MGKNKMKRSTEGMIRLQEALAKAVTAADFDEIARQLLAKAKEGNVSAAKLVLESLATPGVDLASDELPDVDLLDLLK
jgi:hypothetical protein